MGDNLLESSAQTKKSHFSEANVSSTGRKPYFPKAPVRTFSPLPPSSDDGKSESGSPIEPHIGISKNWVLPPRNKPGRKAALEKPPTKRQEQNRAAQKAFRERKAARVGELERENSELRGYIDMLRTQLDQSVKHVRYLTSIVAQQQSNRKVVKQKRNNNSSDVTLEAKTEHPPSPNSLSNEPSREENKETKTSNTSAKTKPVKTTVVTPTLTEAIPLRRKRKPREPDNSASNEQNCSFCLKSSGCLCRDLGLGTPPDSGSGDSTAECMVSTSKKQKIKELDFTSSSIPGKPISVSFSGEITDDCGFCSSGGPCVCREEHDVVNRQYNPPKIDVDNMRTCIPGGCSQCLTDPTGKKFCRSMADKVHSSSCTQEVNYSAPGTPHSLVLPAVYRTLSSHKAFESASMEQIIEALVPKSRNDAENGQNGMVFDVDVVMDAINVLNSKFGAEK